MYDPLRLEKEVALRLGWTDLEEKIYGGVRCLVGLQPGTTESLCVLPQWMRKNADVFKLMVEQGVYPQENGFGSIVFPALIAGSLGSQAPCEIIAQHPDKETAVRAAIVRAVIAKLAKE